MEPAGHAGAGVGGGSMAGQRHDHCRAQPWHPRGGQTTRRDPLLRLEFADWIQCLSLLRTIRQRWSIENSWHWVRDVPLREDAHRYREFNGVQILATLRSLAINALRRDGIWSITEGIASLAHDIEGLLRLLGWRATAGTPSG